MSIRKSLVWSYSSQFAAAATSFATTVVIARLLSPRDLGVYATASALAGLITTFTTFGVSTYVVREPEMPREKLRAASTVNAGLAIFLSTVLFCISLFLGSFQKDIRLVLALLAINPLIGLLEFGPWAMTMREGRFKLFAGISMLRTIVGSLVTLPFAFAGFGPASLALGSLAGYILSIIIYASKRPDDIVLIPTFQGLRPIVTFGVQMVSISGASQLAGKASDLVLGKFQGLPALGLYSRASGLSVQISNNLYGLAATVLFSKMSEELRTTGSLHRVYLKALSVLTAVMWPILIGVAVLARPFIAHLYGPKWLGATAPLILLMIAQFIGLGFGMSWELFVLRQETARQTRIELIRAVGGTAVFACGALFSLTLAAVGRVAEALLGYFLYRPHVDRLAGTAPGEMERLYLRGLVLTSAAVFPAFALMVWKNFAADTDLIQIGAAILIGGGLWFAVLIIQRHPLFEELLRLRVQFMSRLAARATKE